MNLTDYHAKYFAYELTKRCPSDSIEKLANAVAGAQVDLNPHQVDAALFAFRSPLSKGALLAELNHRGRDVHSGHVRHVEEAREKSHACAGAAAEVNAARTGGDAGALREVHRGLKTADVNLFAHEQFPEPTFRAGINGLNVGEMNLWCGFHSDCLARMVSNEASTRAEILAESDGE